MSFNHLQRLFSKAWGQIVRQVEADGADEAVEDGILEFQRPIFIFIKKTFKFFFNP